MSSDLLSYLEDQNRKHKKKDTSEYLISEQSQSSSELDIPKKAKEIPQKKNMKLKVTDEFKQKYVVKQI